MVRPSPRRQPTHQVVGESIIASLGGAAVTVQWLPAAGVDRFYAGRPGLVNPFPKEIWKDAPLTLTVFLVQIRNQTSEDLQFEPTLIFLADQRGRRVIPIPYEDMYLRLSEAERSGPSLRSLHATLFSRYVVLPPGDQREALLVFPGIDPDAKVLILEFASFFIGGKSAPGLFEFQVLRENPQ